MRRGAALVALALAALALAGCGGSSSSDSGITIPKVGAARQFTLGAFSPSAVVAPGRPVRIAFTVRMPDGQPLTRYKTGAGPHTGVHLIIVRDDLAYIIHEHPPIGPDGQLRQTVRFPAPGQYRVLVDLYPNLPGTLPNFQLFTTIHVAGTYHAAKLPAFRSTQTIDGYRFTMEGHPNLHAIQAQFVHVTVTTPAGKPLAFTPWFGALAHAIFFHQGSLDYFHTHVCGAGAPNCATAFGNTRISGTATAPGHLTLGVLLPVPGTWRLFIQLQTPGGKVLTAPYTLRVGGTS
jgi:hypothetical protein